MNISHAAEQGREQTRNRAGNRAGTEKNRAKQGAPLVSKAKAGDGHRPAARPLYGKLTRTGAFDTDFLRRAEASSLINRVM